LIDVSSVKQTHVDDDFAWLRSRFRLKTDTEPPVRFAAMFKTAGGNRVGKNEECFFSSEFSIEALDEQIILAIEHCLKTDATDIALRRSINSITECHVVSRHGLRDRTRRATYAKKSARYLLSGSDLGKGSILGRVEIDLKSLLVGGDLHLGIHMISLAAIR
jgi:hypothetical protein